MQERESEQNDVQRRTACSPVVRCGLAFIALLIVAAVLLPIFAGGRDGPRAPTCLRNLRGLAVGALMYAEDHDEHLPPLFRWDERILPYIMNRQLFKCPADSTACDLSYGMNREVSGLDVYTAPARAETVMFFDGAGQIVIERHEEGANYAFVDGHGKWLADPTVDFGP